MNRDLSGVCAAAINVDRRLYENDGQMKNLLKQLENFEHPEQDAHPYHSAISKVKSGVDPQSLAEECGFSQGEAELMVRLYGSEPNGHDSLSTAVR